MTLPRIPLAIAVLSALSAFALGWWLSTVHSAPRTPAAAVSVANDTARVPAPRPASDHARETPPASPVLRETFIQQTPARVADFSPALIKLLKNRYSGFMFNPLSENETGLSDEAIALLGITPEERKLAETALGTAHDTIESLCHDAFKVVSQTKEKAELSLPPLPEGKAIKQSLLADLSRALGEDRAQIILARMDDSSFMGFGAGEQTIKIEWKNDQVSIWHTLKTEGGGQTSRGNTSRDLPARYEQLLTRK